MSTPASSSTATSSQETERRRDKRPAPSLFNKALSVFRKDLTYKKQRSVLAGVKDELRQIDTGIMELRKREVEVQDDGYFDALYEAKKCKTPTALAEEADLYVPTILLSARI